MKYIKKAATYIAVAAFWLAIWLVLASIASNKLIFPSPLLVFRRLFTLAGTADFWTAIGMSFLRVVSGVVIAVVFAVLSAAVAARFRILHSFIYPINEIVKATPIVSFIFLAYIIFNKNIGLLPVFIVMLIVFPVIYGSVLESLRSVERQLIEVADVFGATNGEKLRYLWIPTSLSAFASSASISLGLGWKAGIAAEALAAAPALVGIGTELATAKTYLETVDQFAWTVAIVVLSMIIELLFSFGMKKLKEKLL